MSTQSKTYLTPEQYLEIERKAEFKSEYYRGEMFAMSGAQEPHVLITGDAFGELRQQFRGRSCRAYSNDMRVGVTTAGLYTYPDVVAVCGKPEFLDAEVDTLANPTVIIEVLSPSTEAYDRGLKFKLYRSLESLKEYLLISSLDVSAELYTRQADDQWLLTVKDKLEDSIELMSVDCHLRLADLYERVDHEGINMSTQSKSHLTPEQYLEIERKAEFKSEYYQGEMFAMSGARLAHIQIVSNMMRELGVQLLDRPCEPLSNDMRVCVGPIEFYTYPDIVVVCGGPQMLDNQFDNLVNPTVIVEVLSKSTEAYDRGQKFRLYRSLESLKEYLLVSSLDVSAGLLTRQPDGQWLMSSKDKLEDSIELKSIDCQLSMAEVYRRVEFTPS
jgi:Uma2 family endonuclease